MAKQAEPRATRPCRSTILACCPALCPLWCLLLLPPPASLCSMCFALTLIVQWGLLCVARHNDAGATQRCAVTTSQRGQKTLTRSGLPAGPGAQGRPPPSPSLSPPPPPRPNWRVEPADRQHVCATSVILHSARLAHIGGMPFQYLHVVLSHACTRLSSPSTVGGGPRCQCSLFRMCLICQCIFTLATTPNPVHGPPHDSSVYSPLAPPPPQP